jgi:hypothetical protein
MNGCSARGTIDLPQITSYDYDAPLDEQGNPTEKYFALQKMLHEEYPALPQAEPLVKDSFAQTAIPLTNKVSLFATLETISQRQSLLAFLLQHLFQCLFGKEDSRYFVLIVPWFADKR